MRPAFLFIFLLIASFAHSNETFIEAEALINAEIPCNQLSEEQFESLGDYYMEQMHPGEEHEVMDKMMGGEDSESLHEMHVAMGQNIYCGISENTNHGMMGGMMGYNTLVNSTTNQALYTALLAGAVILVYLLIVKIWKGEKK
ncbi:MAG: hypothetical protein GOU98_01030 [Candidatus Altiarchaeota archaeon]|nr:hypothetical protein [Candidatus Altiarchaeota archaeon]